MHLPLLVTVKVFMTDQFSLKLMHMNQEQLMKRFFFLYPPYFFSFI